MMANHRFGPVAMLANQQMNVVGHDGAGIAGVAAPPDHRGEGIG